MSDLNLPPEEQADHSGPIVDPDSFGGDEASTDDDRATAPDPGTVPPPD